MTRLQKKCLIAVAGTHLLLVVALLCSGFLRPKPDDSEVLTVIPANIIDAAASSGVRNAQTAAAHANYQTTGANASTPPVPQPPKPVEPMKPVEPVQQPEEAKPVEHTQTKPKQTPHQVEPNLTLARNKPTQPDNSAVEAEAKAAERAARKAQQARVRAIENAARAIKENVSSAMQIEMPGTGSVSYASYASVIKSIYEREWQTPSDVSNDDANTRVSVTVSRDGTVISSRILTPSGDAKVDASVQQTLDKVNFIAPFPDGATESQKEFIITFNLKSKRMLG